MLLRSRTIALAFLIASQLSVSALAAKLGSTTTVAASPNPVMLGAGLTLQATVQGSGAVPTGAVSFYADSELLGSASLNESGVATLSASTAGQQAGAYSITATYAGNSNYNGSTSSATTLTLQKAAATVAVSATPNPATVGQSVTVKATVTGPDGTPTGSVSFMVAGQIVATVNLSAGTATLTDSTNGLAPGTYPITASYSGSSSYNASASAAYDFALNQAPTSTTFAAAPNPVTIPNAITLSATVKRSATGAAGVPGGSVSFNLGTLLLGTATLNVAGVAKISQTTGSVPAGTYSVTATYSGDSADVASTSSPLSITVAPAPPGFAYTLNSNLNPTGLGNMSAYSEASGTGALALLPNSPYATELPSPTSLVVDAQQKLLFAGGVNGGDQSLGQIAAFSINNASGNLTAEAATVPADVLTAMAVGPNGQYLYVSHHDSDSISAYSVAANGALTEISGSPFSLPSSNCGLFCSATADGLTYDAVNEQVYVVSNDGWIVGTFTVDTSSGALTWVYNEPSHEGPNAVVSDPTGKFVYATNGASADVSAYAITPGAMSGDNPEPLTPVMGSPFAAGGTPNSLVIEPSGKYLYVTNNGDNTISAYQIDSSSGALAQISGSPFAITGGGSEPEQIVVDPTGKYLYVACAALNGNSTGAVTAFSITASTGAITQLSGSPFSLGTNASDAMQIGVYKVQ